MYFLIDYENVNCNGLKGCSYLQTEDTVEIFYSQACLTIENRIFDQLKQSGCDIKICKLLKNRKNALDFYITSRIGELVGKGHAEPLVIISNDQGFKSVQEYWRECSDMSKKIVLSGCIADGIVSANQVNERHKKVKEEMKMVSLEAEYAKWEENLRIRNLLKEKFEGTEYIDKLDEIQNVYKKQEGKKVLYLDSLKHFGKKNGVIIYNQMKELVV